MNRRLGRAVHPTLVAYLFLMPALVGLFLYTLVPLGSGFVLSFTRYAGVGDAGFVGLRNYMVAFTDPVFLRALGTTVAYALVLVPLQVLLGLALALLLNRRVRGLRWFRTTFFIPYVVPWIAASILFRSMFSPNGMADGIAGLFGLVPPRWLEGDTATSNVFWVVVVASLWKGVGFTMLVFLAALQDVPIELHDAAKVDGAGRWRRFLLVTRPSIQPVTIFLVLITAIASMQAFTPFYLIPRAGAESAAYGVGLNNVAVYAFGQAFQDLHYGYGAALLWIVGFILLTLTFVQLRFSAYGLRGEQG